MFSSDYADKNEFVRKLFKDFKIIVYSQGRKYPAYPVSPVKRKKLGNTEMGKRY